MKSNKRGAISYEQIILFIVAIVVLILVVGFFTDAFSDLRKPVDIATDEIDKGIECRSTCQDKGFDKFCSDKCYEVSGMTCLNAEGIELNAEGCSA
ncbi:hypothetical protein ACFLZZ_02105 [Nanoarchaeota archaeon]